MSYSWLCPLPPPPPMEVSGHLWLQMQAGNPVFRCTGGGGSGRRGAQRQTENLGKREISL